MTSWTYANPGRRFYGCGSFRGMRKKGCNHFEWVDEEMSSRAKDVIRNLKDQNDELMDLSSEFKKKEELMKMKIKLMGYFLGFSMVFVLLLVFALVATHVFK